MNTAFKEDLREERVANQSSANTLSVALIVLLSLVFGVLGYLLVERRARRDDRRRVLHGRFSDVLQLARSEEEAYAVVKRYLEQLVPGGRATVLNRNSSANRLEAGTPVENPDLRLTLETVEPEACMAIRGGKTYQRRRNGDELMTCAVCGALGDQVTCVPSLVGGEVVGSVLVEHPNRLPGEDTEQLSAGIAESAPVISNLRNLAIAQMRASTDALTGLSNRPRLQTTHLPHATELARRGGEPMTVVMIDLDHFKRFNDEFGHPAPGDRLAQERPPPPGRSRSARSTKLARYGGEEFILLLPDTGHRARSDGRREPACGDRRDRGLRGRARRSPPASAWRSCPATPATRISCFGAPTGRSTPPRRTAATAWKCSRPTAPRRLRGRLHSLATPE